MRRVHITNIITLDCSRSLLCSRPSPPPGTFLLPSLKPKLVSPFINKKLLTLVTMDASEAVTSKGMPLSLDPKSEEEYVRQSKLLQEFSCITSINKAWVFNSNDGNGSRAVFSIGQPNLLANKKRTHILSSYISKGTDISVDFQWAPFPIEMTGVSTIVPSPSGLKMLVVRNQENDSPTQFEIWGPCELEKEIHIPKSVHGSVYTDGWFEGISWNSNETLIAYVAEEPSSSKPVFDGFGYKKGGSKEMDGCSWKGQGDWEEDWGESYAGKRQPALFVANIVSGDVRAIDGIPKSLSVGQVVWAPVTEGMHQYLVFVGWSSQNASQKYARKLGIKFCYNRPCALYAVRCDSTEDLAAAINLTQGISSAFFPRFSPDGSALFFLSAKRSVDTGAHSATDSLHRIDWLINGKPDPCTKMVDVVPVVMCPEDGCFPGLYGAAILSKPWLSDGCTMVLSSYWGSTQVILTINVLSGTVSRVSPNDTSSWKILALDGDNILAVSSSPVEPPRVKYGYHFEKEASVEWGWLDVSSPVSRYSEKVRSLLTSLQFDIMKIPVKDATDDLTKGAKKPYEAIFVSSGYQKSGAVDPMIVILHGGPHTVSLTSFSKNLAFLCSLGYSLLIVNYRGSLGFGEEALQSVLGRIGSQDVNDVLGAVDHVIELGLADPSKVAVLGGSHGGFLTTHLIGQAPNKFAAAAARNPVCNLALMVGTCDIPEWCYVETYGSSKGNAYFTEAPSVEHLQQMYSISPISHLSKVRTPSLFLLGAQDLRVPLCNGLQYVRALKEKGVDVKVMVFPHDEHGIERPQSDFESFLNIGVWFNKYLK